MDAGGFYPRCEPYRPADSPGLEVLGGREQELGSLFAFLQGVVELFV